MNILILTDEIFPDAIGGVGKSVYNECVALVRRGHHVTVVVRSVKADLAATTTQDGIIVHRLQGPVRSSKAYYLYPLYILFHLTRWLRQSPNPFDVIYTFNPLYILPTRWVSRWRSVSLVHVFYSSMSAEIRINAKRGKYGRLRILADGAAFLLYQMEKWAFSSAKRILPRSQYTRETFQQLFPQIPANEPMPTGVDIDVYKVIPIEEARQKVSLPSERPILITVRRLEGRMGLHNLITAIAQVRQTYPNVLLLITGKGYLRESLEKLVAEKDLQDNVRFLGFVSEADLPFYLASANAFVLPTEMLEGFGLATVEALATGVPAIGTPVGATPEILSPLDPKLITSDITPESIAETITYWLSHPEELSTLKQRSRTHVEQHYDANLVAQQLETLFASLVSTSPPSSS